MVLGLPRSSTTWISNWLTTDTTTCLHDPVWKYHYTEFNKIKTSKRLGVACTGLFRFPEWVNAHPAKKVIIHRDLGDINISMMKQGLPFLTKVDEEKLWSIQGFHVTQEDLFTGCPKLIYEYLLEISFDAERFELLRHLNVQNDNTNTTINIETLVRFDKELGAI